MAEREAAIAKAAEMFTARRNAATAQDPALPAAPDPEPTPAPEAASEAALEAPEGVSFDDDDYIPGIDPDPEDDVSDDADAPSPEMHRVTVRGEDVEVTLDELKKGYSREADYRHKTRAVAEKDRELDALRTSLSEKEQRYDALLTHLHGQWEKVEVLSPEELAHLYQTDPQKWAVEKERVRERNEQMSAALAERQRLAQEHQDEILKRLKEFSDAEQEKLVEMYPEWKDEEVRSKDRDRLAKHAVEVLGFSRDEVKATIDSRLIRMLRDSAELHELKGKKPAIPKKQGATPSRKGPSTARNARGASRRRRARKRLAETGHVDDAQPVIKDILQRKREATRR